MLLSRDPGETYRRVDFDARVKGASSLQLVALCLEQAAGSLGRAIYAQEHCDNAAKSAALTRAVAAITALELGVDSSNPVGAPLLQLYQAARRTILDNALRFDARQLETIRTDLLDIREAMLGTAAG
ncbi:flagellar export chaperone FliS [Novosphingobium sp. AAP93]|uniref:flagellar export chaperone FliS n=1 Tax=Novosphingobium sp. AAP93 TaxID=1523427 RepID=UPI0006B984BE|nr:flagellar protein FliS [Novosphingobium sp. AAP93]KPF84791.1 flagellin [Novosphingobium sp. AAP93]